MHNNLMNAYIFFQFIIYWNLTYSFLLLAIFHLDKNFSLVLKLHVKLIKHLLKLMFCFLFIFTNYY